jgi:hypothetical protein
VNLKFRVDDDMSATARVTLKITTKRGRVVRTFRVGWVPTATQRASLRRCTLKPGAYFVKVYAIDEATNPQVKAAKAKLTVR